MRHHIFLERCLSRVLVNRLAGLAMLACIGGQAALTQEAASQIRDLTSVEEVSELFGTPGPGLPIQELVPTGDPDVFSIVSHRIFETAGGEIGHESVNAGILVIDQWYGPDPMKSFTMSGGATSGFDIPGPELCPDCPDLGIGQDVGDVIEVESHRISGEYHASDGSITYVGGFLSASSWTFASADCSGSMLHLCAETVGEDPAFPEDPTWQRPLRVLRQHPDKAIRDAEDLFHRFHWLFEPGGVYVENMSNDRFKPWKAELVKCQRQFYDDVRTALNAYAPCMNACSTKPHGLQWAMPRIGAACLGGGGLGAACGNVVPGVGTIVGAIGGLVVGGGAAGAYCLFVDSPREECEADCEVSLVNGITKALQDFNSCRYDHVRIGSGR